MFLEIFGGILMVIVGIVLFLYPELPYEFREAIQSDCPGEPSDLYRKCNKVGGILVAIAGAAIIILSFVLN